MQNLSTFIATYCRASIWMLLPVVIGCQSIGDPGELTSDSLLKAATSSPDAVTLDIYWARTDATDQAFADALWQAVEEDRIPVEVRVALAEDGLRAGVVGGTPSDELARLLNPEGQTLQPEDESTNALSAEPAKVTRRLKQLRPGKRLELQAADAVSNYTLLRGKSGNLVGQTFPDAQGIYGVEVVGVSGDRVSLELSPELHFGQPRMKYIPSGPGMVVQQLARDTKVFDELRTRVELAPGEMLVLTSLPRCDHRLGGLLHRADNHSPSEQKYLLLRLSQTPDAVQLAANDESLWPWQ